jgi:lysophospholipase L1-like esterase
MHLLPCVLSHQPVDLLIIMLGSNDLKSRYGDQSRSTAHGLARMVDAVRSSQSPNPSDRVPEILVVISPKVIQPSRRMEQEFGEVTGAEAVRVECISICKSLGVSFLDANLIIRSSDEDGVHIDEAAHSILATHLAAQIHGMGQRNLVETGRAQRAGNPPSVSAPIEY